MTDSNTNNCISEAVKRYAELKLERMVLTLSDTAHAKEKLKEVEAEIADITAPHWMDVSKY